MWELSPRLRYVSGVPELPWSPFPPFFVSCLPCSSLSAACCAALVEDIFLVVSFLTLLEGSFPIDREWRGEKECRRAGYKEQRTLKLLQGNFLNTRAVAVWWPLLRLLEAGKEEVSTVSAED